MRPPVVRRILRGTRIVLALVVAATLLDVGPVRAQDGTVEPAPALGGYQGSAAASGLHVLYGLEGLLPIPPPLDLGSPDSLATIASGPSTFARAAVVDPGDLLANPDALPALASPDYPAGTLPPWPFRVSASSGIGEPVAESNPAPGLSARAEVDPSGSAARASSAAVDVPAVVTVGSMSSLATTSTDGAQVTVRARSQISGVNILGLITIDSVVTDLTATSSGGDTTLEGGTNVVGAELAGQPVTIDADGIHQKEGSPLLGGLLGPVTQSLNDALEQVGIHVTAVGPVELSGGKEGQLASSGLRIDFELSRSTFPALAAVFDAIPPIENPVPGAPSIEDVLAAAQARHLVSVEIGRGVVTLAARTAGAGFTPLPPPSVPVVDTPSFDAPVPGPLPGFEPPAAPTTPDAPVAQPVSTTDPVEIPTGAGVGALVLLVLLALPFAGERLAWICTSVLGGDAGASCPLEGR